MKKMFSVFFDFCRENSFEARIERQELRDRVRNLEESFDVLCNRVSFLEKDNKRLLNHISYLKECINRKGDK